MRLRTPLAEGRPIPAFVPFLVDLSIAHLRVAVRCNAPACVPGIEALLALFAHCDTTGKADVGFSIEADDGGAALSCNGEHIWRGEEPGEVVAAFEWALYNRVIAALYPRFVSLHAATIVWQGSGIAIAGASGAGKSSLCTAALLAGADYFSDEYSLLDEHGCVTSFPRPLQWGGQSHPAFSRRGMCDSGLFGMASYTFTARDGHPVTSLLWHPKRLGTVPVSLSLLLLPRFDARADKVMGEPVARSQALMELAAEMHHRLPIPDRLRELHRRIPATTRMMRLVFADVHQAWDHVERIVGSGE
jgi:hypothetical protein